MTLEEANKRIAQIYEEADSKIEIINADVEKQLIDTYKKSLKEVRSKLTDLYEKIGDKPSLADASKFGRLSALEKDLRDTLKNLGVRTRSVIQTNIADNFSQAFYTSGFANETSLNINAGFGGLDTRTIQASITNPLDKIGWKGRLTGEINSLNNTVRQTITEGLVQGYGLPKTARILRNKIGGSVSDTLRIIRTEAQRAKSVGRNLAFDRVKAAGDRQGFKITHVWRATLDLRTRSDHRALDGKKADKNGIFHIRGFKTRGPGLFGVASEDINCRCIAFIQVNDVKPDFRKDNLTKEIIPETDYTKWAKSKGIPNKFKLEFKK